MGKMVPSLARAMETNANFIIFLQYAAMLKKNQQIIL
jgi:hypothetical protein